MQKNRTITLEQLKDLDNLMDSIKEEEIQELLNFYFINSEAIYKLYLLFESNPEKFRKFLFLLYYEYFSIADLISIDYTTEFVLDKDKSDNIVFIIKEENNKKYVYWNYKNNPLSEDVSLNYIINLPSTTEVVFDIKDNKIIWKNKWLRDKWDYICPVSNLNLSDNIKVNKKVVIDDIIFPTNEQIYEYLKNFINDDVCFVRDYIGVYNGSRENLNHREFGISDDEQSKLKDILEKCEIEPNFSKEYFDYHFEEYMVRLIGPENDLCNCAIELSHNIRNLSIQLNNSKNSNFLKNVLNKIYTGTIHY